MADELAFAAICAVCNDQTVPERLRPEASGMLGDVLISNSKPLSDQALSAVDAFFEASVAVAPALAPTPAALPDAAWFSIGSTQLAVWRGDICRLGVGAVVNAANEAGLGCFEPAHRCIDNVLHRAAGPRLREECRSYRLHATHVLHVTGPCLQPRGRQPTAEEQQALARCYTGCLEAAFSAGIRSLAFCCLSAGLFGYPSCAAATVALDTVSTWLKHDASRQLAFDAIVFDVFTAEDEANYRALAAQLLEDEPAAPLPPLAPLPPEVEQAARDIAGADHLLIVAAAGLSISLDLPNNPYHSQADFARHYPVAASYGYRDGFEAMRLAADERLPPGARLAHTAKHFLNMRYRFPPTQGYALLRQLADSFGPSENTFVWTSNVDGCFERSGFDAARVYQAQGEMSRYQCARPTCQGHVWECEAQLRAVDAASPDGVLRDLDLASGLACTRCGARPPDLLPNLRGGDWFNHAPYEAAQARLLAWLDELVEAQASIAVVEVGVGPGTPIVTRIPASAFASAVAASGGKAAYVRINPDAPEGPREDPSEAVAFTRLRDKWTALGPLVAAAVQMRTERIRGAEQAPPAEPGPNGNPQESAAWRRRYTDILLSLRTPRSR
eukprot:CAMPEP_0171887950 /NCGR_PEP_ID=MMETSP0992-20121227/42731_1 /TAXON_ID=483369 /ORGANISM="non described non described, Strain CCMP2098" /LENGTH=613 /DNA_ID=CAMNT_0012514757 /DNA_START=72 /DNA_END=1913 /DNA_ORIENTATION=+